MYNKITQIIDNYQIKKYHLKNMLYIFYSAKKTSCRVVLLRFLSIKLMHFYVFYVHNETTVSNIAVG